MTKPDIARYMYCLLSSLKVVHNLGYIHRDVKPSNFLYNMNLQTGVLIDFGLAQKAPSQRDSVQEAKRLSRLPPPKGTLGKALIIYSSSVRAAKSDQTIQLF